MYVQIYNYVQIIAYTYIYLLQEGESTPGITGYFEVTVNGETVHSKKVT